MSNLTNNVAFLHHYPPSLAAMYKKHSIRKPTGFPIAFRRPHIKRCQAHT